MRRLILILMMCWGLSTAAEAQNSVSGKVVDENYQPIPGVRVSSTRKNGPTTLTDLDGQFTMEDTKRPRRVRAEYVGFKSTLICLKWRSALKSRTRLRIS